MPQPRTTATTPSTTTAWTRSSAATTPSAHLLDAGTHEGHAASCWTASSTTPARGFWQFHHVLECGDGSPYMDWFHFDPERLTRKQHCGAYPGPQRDRGVAARRRTA
ncbi:MAG: hypothetical protein MZV65_36145 [Chromatiales bacterium]|nr:hypothetical protein [Chromatiales bacterium]